MIEIMDPTLGAIYRGEGRCDFLVWAPRADRIDLHLLDPDRTVTMKSAGKGYFSVILDGIRPGDLYRYRLDGGEEYPDPASRFQPRGVHGPSQVVDSAFPWGDDHWRGIPLEDYVLYEIHTGLFTAGGDFDAIIPELPQLKELGVTAIELMPVAQFPGERNWGYDGVDLFAVHYAYGGPGGLRRLIDACHRLGLAVALDVVYNHLGPEGNYLPRFGPYFTERYRTPWGAAVNFDGFESDEVRRFFIENALFWVRDFHIDLLRLDAVHAIYDFSARHILEELAENVHRAARRINRTVWVVAESALNDSRLIRRRETGGYGLDAQWNDDFHHALRTLLTGDRAGYYVDFGRVEHLAKAYSEGYVYTGEYSAFRRRSHGNSARSLPGCRFVAFAQNHDQIGNRMKGERLGAGVSFSGLKLAAGAVLLSPFLPLLFMGEEYDEPAPFQYFVHHADPDLVEAVRRGRKEEFASFEWEEAPPDPQEEATFRRCKLNGVLRHEGRHRMLRDFYRELIRLRRRHPALSFAGSGHMRVSARETPKLLLLHRWFTGREAFSLFHFGRERSPVEVPFPPGVWTKIFDSSEPGWNGPGGTVPARGEGGMVIEVEAETFAVFSREDNVAP